VQNRKHCDILNTKVSLFPAPMVHHGHDSSWFWPSIKSSTNISMSNRMSISLIFECFHDSRAKPLYETLPVPLASDQIGIGQAVSSPSKLHSPFVFESCAGKRCLAHRRQPFNDFISNIPKALPRIVAKTLSLRRCGQCT